MGSLDLGEEQVEEATLRVGEHSDRHDRSDMRTLTYPVGRKLPTCMSTKQLVVALRAAIEGLVCLYIPLKYNSQTIVGHHFELSSESVTAESFHNTDDLIGPPYILTPRLVLQLLCFL
jgi:hypothetical protein